MAGMINYTSFKGVLMAIVTLSIDGSCFYDGKRNGPDILLQDKSKLVVYPDPQGEPESKDYEVMVDDKPTFCYTSYREDEESSMRINGRSVSPMSFACFDINGEVTVKVKLKKPAKTVAIRPLSLEIKHTLVSDTVTFQLKKPCNISVEPYGELNALHIFANPVEKDVPKQGDPKVHYFGPGVHHADPIRFKDGDTVYIAGGAVVYAKPQPLKGDEKTSSKPYGIEHKLLDPWFLGSSRKHIKIRGRGILCARKTLEAKQRHRLIHFSKCEDISVEGIILREAAAWTLTFDQSANIHVDNVKILGHYVNNDGIEVSGSRDAVVENSFIHNGDDSFCVKAWKPAKNITFRNCVAWNDVAMSFGIVCEIYEEVSNVTYKDCTVLHSTGKNTKGEWNVMRGVIGIWIAHGGHVHDVRFEDIVIENASETKDPIKLRVTGDKPGTIEKVLFKNIKVLNSKNEKVGLYGPEGSIKDIAFENIQINGKDVEVSSKLEK
jgi:hypothetical protein